LSDNSSGESLPAGFIDALIGYAIDPVRWESFAKEMDKGRDQIASLDPTELLTTLSKAEALAWQLKGQPDLDMQRAGCIFYLLDNKGGVLEASSNTATLEDYCTVVDGALRFVSPATQSSFAEGLKALRKGSQHQVLVELLGDVPFSCYGYLVPASDLPSALNLANTKIRFGFLVAHADSGEQTGSVLQSSFGLTAAEVGVCQQLTSGMQLKEVAQHLGISSNTARNHLQSVFEKTNINRQGDLILMMTQLSVILSVIGSHGEMSAPSSASMYPPYEFAVVDHDGPPRRIAYRRYGNGPNPVVHFHESVGTSRLLPGTDDIATRLGLTIIVPERAGAGFSEPVDNYSFNTTTADVEALIDRLGFTRVTLVGYLSGAAHALASAAHLGERVKGVMSISGRGPSGLSYSERSPLASLRRNLSSQPWLLSTFFNILRNRVSKETNRSLLVRLYGSASKDRALFDERPDILEHMVDSTLESFTVSAAGVVADIGCFTNPAPVDLRQITAPIIVWHGDEDPLSSFANLRKELHGIEFDSRIFEGWGSALIYQYWREILEQVAALSRAG